MNRRRWSIRPVLRGLRALTIFGILTAPAARGADPGAAADWIPFDRLTSTNRALARSVTDHYTVRREYETRPVRARREYFEFLMDHLEACSVLAQNQRLITYRAIRRADGRVFADNRAGASGTLFPLLAEPGRRVYYVQGVQKGIFTARGRGVAVVRYEPKTSETMEYTGAVFVKVDNTVLAALTQLFAPFLTGAVDRNFDQVMRHPVALSESATADPQGMLAAIDRMPAVDRHLLDPLASRLRTVTNPPAAPPAPP